MITPADPESSRQPDSAQDGPAGASAGADRAAAVARASAAGEAASAAGAPSTPESGAAAVAAGPSAAGQAAAAGLPHAEPSDTEPVVAEEPGPVSPPGLVSDPDPDPDSGSDPDPDSAVDPDRDSTVDSGPGTDSADRQAAADPTGLDVVPESAATDAAAVPHLSTPDSCAVPDPDGDTPPPPAPGVPVEVSVATGLLGVGLVLQLIVPVQTLLAGVPADHWGPVALALFQWFGFLAVYAFFAVSAYRGAHWARILLLVLAAVAVFGFLADMAERVFGLAAILHCVAVLLLFLPGARAHFASDDHPPR